MVNPPPVKNDLVCTHRGEVRIVWHSTTTPIAGTLTTKQLVDAMPGASVTWDRVQFHKFDAFGSFNLNFTAGNHPIGSALPIAATLLDPLNVNSGNNDVPTFYNDGVGTMRRAHVGIVPNLLYRQTWIPTVDTNPLISFTTVPYELTGTDYFFQILLQYTCVVRSVFGSPAPQVAAEVRRSDNFAIEGTIDNTTLERESIDGFQVLVMDRNLPAVNAEDQQQC
jgi:hypothetical protein